MNATTVVSLLKDRLGISAASTYRDSYLVSIAQSVLDELTEEKGLTLDSTNMNQLLFVVDYAAWRYLSRDKDIAMPRHIQARLHNMMIHCGGVSRDV